MTPEVSIIVPIYNVGEPLLRACIESALAQTFTDFELILVDDASTDNSAAICASYSDSHIRLLRLSRNGGLANARNQGVEISTGKYLTFLDADDRLTEDALQQMVAVAKESGATIVAADFKKVKPLTLSRCECAETLSFEMFTPTEAVADILYQRDLNNSACGKLYQRDLCVKFPFKSGWFEDLRTFYHFFLAADKIAYLPVTVYLYTDNPASYMNTFNIGRAVVLDVTEELVDYMEQNHPELAPAAHDRALSAAFNIFNLMAANRVADDAIDARCRATIKRYRRESLLNPHVRLKNKLGILITYIGGFTLLKLAAKLLQKP